MGVVVWIVGEPGLGKTTLARGLLGEVRLCLAHPKWTIGTTGVHAAGHYTGKPFDGADTIGYTDGTRTLEAWDQYFAYRSTPWEGVTIFDGDRLSNAKCLDFFKKMAAPPKLVSLLLVAPSELGEARRLERARAAGVPPQNATWVKGRITKSRNFHERFDPNDRYIVHADVPDSIGRVQALLETWRRLHP